MLKHLKFDYKKWTSFIVAIVFITPWNFYSLFQVHFLSSQKNSHKHTCIWNLNKNSASILITFTKSFRIHFMNVFVRLFEWQLRLSVNPSLPHIDIRHTLLFAYCNNILLMCKISMRIKIFAMKSYTRTLNRMMCAPYKWKKGKYCVACMMCPWKIEWNVLYLTGWLIEIGL